ncbi:MAG TPA: ATP-binding cassette domain-containing protein [Pirellulales bacterium]
MLETRQLSVRFGGVVAVCELDLKVDAKTIFSIIGPNGAGKTTLFNAVTGLVVPTAGSIHFAGHDLRRRWSVRTTAACLAIALCCAMALAAVAADLNGLWRATIRRPANFQDTPFSAREAWKQATGYLHGELAIERRRAGHWQIVTADGRIPLGMATDRAAAEADRAQLDWLSRQSGGAHVVGRGNGWMIESPRGAPAHEVGPFASRLAAEEKLALLAQIDRRRWQRRRLVVFVFGFGVLVGGAGTWAAWRRARWTPELVAKAGIARTFQNLRLFRGMTARENVLVALDQAQRGFARNAHRPPEPPNSATDTNPKRERGRSGSRPRLRFGLLSLGEQCGLWRKTWRWRSRNVEQRSAAEADALLGRVGLIAPGTSLAGQLSYGDQRRLEIARALATRPRLLLLDEPAAGMNAVETAALMQLVRDIRDDGTTVVLIEHQMELVMGISDRIAVLDGGRKIAEGTPGEVRRDPAVLAAYLG